MLTEAVQLVIAKAGIDLKSHELLCTTGRNLVSVVKMAVALYFSAVVTCVVPFARIMKSAVITRVLKSVMTD